MLIIEIVLIIVYGMEALMMAYAYHVNKSRKIKIDKLRERLI